MGKTEKGAVWLNDKMFSYYDYWQFWRNTDDKDVARFLKFFTDISSKEIDELSKTQEINKLKIKLANETTRILHGNSKSIQAEKTAKDTFELGKINTNLPTTNISKDKVTNGIKLLELLVDNKIMNSKSEVRRAILNNGIKVNGILVKNENKIINLPDFQEESMKISYGKKKHYLFKII